MHFLNLPDHLFFVIHSFLSSRPRTIENEKEHLDSYHFREYRGDCLLYSLVHQESQSLNKWNCVLTTTPKFSELKKQASFLSFSPKWSMEFCTNEQFNSYVQQQIIMSSSEQLSLRFNKEFPSNQLNHYFCVYQLDLNDLDVAISLSTLKDVKILELSRCFITDESCSLNSLVFSIFCLKNSISFQKILFTKIIRVYLAGGESISPNVAHLSALGNYPTLKQLFINEERSSLSSFHDPPVDCLHVEKLYLTDASLSIVKNLSGIEELHVYSNLDLDLLMVPKTHGDPSSLLPGLGKLISLHLYWCDLVDNIHTNIFPCLRVFTLTECSEFSGIYLDGNSLEIFSLDGSVISHDSHSDYFLDLIDIQCPSLTKLSLKGIATEEPVQCIMRHFIPKVTIEYCSIEVQLNCTINPKKMMKWE
jgi:hypothetical protein